VQPLAPNGSVTDASYRTNINKMEEKLWEKH